MGFGLGFVVFSPNIPQRVRAHLAWGGEHIISTHHGHAAQSETAKRRRRIVCAQTCALRILVIYIHLSGTDTTHI